MEKSQTRIHKVQILNPLSAIQRCLITKEFFSTYASSLELPILVIGPLNQCLALKIHEETTRMTRPTTATGV